MLCVMSVAVGCTPMPYARHTGASRAGVPISHCQCPCQPHLRAAAATDMPRVSGIDADDDQPHRLPAQVPLHHAQLVALDRAQRRALGVQERQQQRSSAQRRERHRAAALVGQVEAGCGPRPRLPDGVAVHRRAAHRRAGPRAGAVERGRQRQHRAAHDQQHAGDRGQPPAPAQNTRRRSVQPHSSTTASSASGTTSVSAAPAETSLGMSAILTQAPLCRTAAIR